jgi:hypothetical protein
MVAQENAFAQPQTQNASATLKPKEIDAVETKARLLGQKIHAIVDELVGDVVRAYRDHRPIHELERNTWQRLLRVGHHTLQILLDLLGTGDVGESLVVEGRTLRRLKDLHRREYTCTFGEFTLERHAYGTREGQEHECVPLDERLALPAGKFSYLLQEWDQSEAMETAFRSTRDIVKRILGLQQHVDSLEQMNRHMAEQVEAYHMTQTAPPAESEGAILVQTADHKGVPLRHPADRSSIADHDSEAADRSDRKQMATLVGVYTIDPCVRTPEDVVESLFAEPGKRPKDDSPRPKPQNKRLRACLSHTNLLGEVIDGTAAMFGWLGDETHARNPDGRKTLLHLTDGEERLVTERDVFQSEVPMTDILDLLHVTPRVWIMGRIFCSNERAREMFVKERVLRILRGEVHSVVQGLRSLATRRRLGAKQRAEVAKVCGYFTRNAYRMKYDEYLAMGYPIASGVIEGACRHVVKDRMERTGMGWTIAGAQAMLELRCLWLTDCWDEYLAFRIERETKALHPHRDQLKEVSWATAV